ncbi:HEPN domain-containing protein [Fimbriiglobus ruber]|nr:HEPN domain-containing protein [Fimbriiglobus ruber]
MTAEQRIRSLDLLRTLAEKAVVEVRMRQLQGARPTFSRAMMTCTVNRDRFLYNDFGLHTFAGHGQLSEKGVWTNEIAQIIISLSSCLEWAEVLSNGTKEDHLKQYLGNILDHAFNRSDVSISVADQMREALVDRPADDRNAFAGQLVKVSLRIVGLVVLCEPLSLKFDDLNLKIRQPVPTDFEYTATVGIEHALADDRSDAIGEFEGNFSGVKDVMKIIGWFRAILRLATGKAVKIRTAICTSVTLRGELTNTICTNENPGRPSFAILTDNNKEKFKIACEQLSPRLVSDQFLEENTRVDHLATGYHRFSDALVKQGLDDYRIATAVTGLESLLVRENDGRKGKKYQLEIRLPTLLGIVGFSPLDVKALISDAYKIRSNFVHGDNKINANLSERIKGYGGPEGILGKCISYLRAVLIISLCALPDKRNRLSLIDNSTIDSSQQSLLETQIDTIKNVVLFANCVYSEK